MQSELDKIRNGKVLILGFAREGISTYQYLREISKDKEIGIADRVEYKKWNNQTKKIIEKDKKIVLFDGLKYLNSLTQYEVVIKSPGIPNKLTEIKNAKKNGVVFTSQTNMFLDLVNGKVIGVTGTKGKSTTASLIHHILSSSGLKSELIGNIGKPCMDYLDKDSKETIFVFEMSSHQLSDVKRSPHIAVFLNIYEEHLDYYEDFLDYFNAKANIALHQKKEDIFIYNNDFQEIEKLANKLKSQKTAFNTNKENANCYIKGSKIILRQNSEHISLINFNELTLKGKHNINNALAAVLAASTVGVSVENIRKALKTFKPLEGRLEIVGVNKGVTYVNDTLATIPEAAIGAVDAFPKKNLTLILGGHDRGIDFSEFIKELVKRDNIKTIITIGALADRLAGVIVYENYKGKLIKLGSSISMKEIVKTAMENTQKGEVVLLSPAATSFDMFKDYKDRGDQFQKAVEELSKK
jgi:UDP-N-acetylmuramoyl-L-alanine---L-glutamate ligase